MSAPLVLDASTAILLAKVGLLESTAERADLWMADTTLRHEEEIQALLDESAAVGRQDRTPALGRSLQQVFVGGPLRESHLGRGHHIVPCRSEVMSVADAESR